MFRRKLKLAPNYDWINAELEETLRITEADYITDPVKIVIKKIKVHPISFEDASETDQIKSKIATYLAQLEEMMAVSHRNIPHKIELAFIAKKRSINLAADWRIKSLNDNKKAAEIISKLKLEKHIDSIVWTDEKNYLTKSAALIKILEILNWEIRHLLNLFPTKLTDFIYDCIAKNRYLIGSCSNGENQN